MLFQPNLHRIVWGGERIAKWKKIEDDETMRFFESDSKSIGESWEVSAVPSSPSVVANGSHAGRLLTDVISEMPNEILGNAVAKKYEGKLPLLVKFIDADKDLSIQVHPDDEMSKREHGKMGKTEMWYVIDAKPGAYLCAGFKKKLTAEEYKKKVADGTIVDALAKHEVKKGDVFYIPSGRVHAICGGVFVAEVQQSSDVTYRIFDYNRPGMDGKPRELHTELAAKALDYSVYDEYRTIYTDENDRANHCIDSPFFNVRVVAMDASFHRDLIKYDSFIITMCIKGRCKLKMRTTGDVVTLHEGYSCLIPAAIADYDVVPDGKVQLLDAFINCKKQDIFSKMTRFLHISKK